MNLSRQPSRTLSLKRLLDSTTSTLPRSPSSSTILVETKPPVDTEASQFVVTLVIMLGFGDGPQL